MPEASIWTKRLSALNEMLDHLKSELAAASSETVKETIKALVSCLQAFAGSQFDFLHDGFESGRLLPSVRYPSDYALQATINQVSHDLTVLQRAAEHRMTGIEVMKATLAKADKLAQDALNLAVKAKMLPPSTVLTYFSKAANIRLIPYAPVALVGLPYTATAVSRDYLAIAHEVGHHVFRNTPGLAQQLWQQMPLEPKWCRPWMEEIFADVYGALVAGPVLGLDFQDLMLNDSLEDFITDDGEHPLEAIRPYLYIAILKELGFTDASKALKKRWQQCLQERGNPSSFEPKNGSGPVPIKEGKVALVEAGLLALKHLQKARQLRVENPDGYWSRELVSGEPVSKLYENFAEWVKDHPEVTVPTLQEFGDDVGIVIGGEEPVNKRRKGDTDTWLDGIKALDSAYKLPEAGWAPVFAANGWNFEGPDDDPPPGDPI